MCRWLVSCPAVPSLTSAKAFALCNGRLFLTRNATQSPITTSTSNMKTAVPPSFAHTQIRTLHLLLIKQSYIPALGQSSLCFISWLFQFTRVWFGFSRQKSPCAQAVIAAAAASLIRLKVIWVLSWLEATPEKHRTPTWRLMSSDHH